MEIERKTEQSEDLFLTLSRVSYTLSGAKHPSRVHNDWYISLGEDTTFLRYIGYGLKLPDASIGNGFILLQDQGYPGLKKEFAELVSKISGQPLFPFDEDGNPIPAPKKPRGKKGGRLPNLP